MCAPQLFQSDVGGLHGSCRAADLHSIPRLKKGGSASDEGRGGSGNGRSNRITALTSRNEGGRHTAPIIAGPLYLQHTHTHKKVPPTRSSPSVNPSWKHPLSPTQRCVSYLTCVPVRLTSRQPSEAVWQQSKTPRKAMWRQFQPSTLRAFCSAFLTESQPVSFSCHLTSEGSLRLSGSSPVAAEL